MIILGIVLLLLAWLLPQLFPVPLPVETLLYDGGWILVVLGVILLILGFVGRPIGNGWGPPVRGRRYWW